MDQTENTLRHFSFTRKSNFDMKIFTKWKYFSKFPFRFRDVLNLKLKNWMKFRLRKFLVSWNHSYLFSTTSDILLCSTVPELKFWKVKIFFLIIYKFCFVLGIKRNISNSGQATFHCNLSWVLLEIHFRNPILFITIWTNPKSF